MHILSLCNDGVTLLPVQDNLTLYHWRRAADEGKEYPFAQFNKSLDIPTYTEEEYTVCILPFDSHVMVM